MLSVRLTRIEVDRIRIKSSILRNTFNLISFYLVRSPLVRKIEIILFLTCKKPAGYIFKPKTPTFSISGFNNHDDCTPGDAMRLRTN